MREFLDLSNALGPDQPFFQLDIFALQQQRHYAGQPVYTSIPILPPISGGISFRSSLLAPIYSAGCARAAIVALEIALQLQAKRREVALLAEFDTPVNGYWRKRPIDWILHGWSLIFSGRLLSRVRERMRAAIGRDAPISVLRRAHLQRHRERHLGCYSWLSPRRVFDGAIHLFRAPRSTRHGFMKMRCHRLGSTGFVRNSGSRCHRRAREDLLRALQPAHHRQRHCASSLAAPRPRKPRCIRSLHKSCQQASVANPENCPAHSPNSLGHRGFDRRYAIAGAGGRPAPRNDGKSPENAISILAARLGLGLIATAVADGSLCPDIFQHNKVQS